MGLIDAFLLEPPRIDFWIADRADGSSGSGTQLDPWNGRFNNTTSYTPSSISSTGSTATLNLTSHPFKMGDRILVTGATGADAKFYNGSFTVVSAPTNSLTYTMSGTPGASASGTLSVRADPYRFDTVMRSLPAGVAACVHLGPGEFQTLGYHEDLSGGWQLKPGQRIVGSGMDVTRIKLVNTTAVDQKAVYAMGHDLSVGGAANLVDFTSIESLTVDCNLSGQSGSQVAAGAVRMMGNHARVSSVKAVNWGNRYHASGSAAGYVFLLITGDLSSGVGVAGVVNCGIDQCIAVQPVLSSPAPTSPVTVFRVGAKEAPSGSAASGEGPYIRNSYVDAGQVASFTNDVRAVSMNWCRAGVVEGLQVRNIRFGGPYETSLGAYEIIVRNNVFRNVTQGLLWQMSSAGVQKLVVEGNTFELATGTSGLLAVQLDDNAAGSPPFGDIVLRNNRIRYLDGAVGGPTWGNGIQVFGATNLSISDNILDLGPTVQIMDRRCTAVKYFNNQKPNQTLIRGNLQTGSSPTFVYIPYNELATEAEEAWILGFLKRA